MTAKNSESTFTFRVDTKLKAEFLKAAQATDRPASLLFRDYMRDYIKQHLPQAQGKGKVQKD